MTETDRGEAGKRDPFSVEHEEVEHVLDVVREHLKAVSLTGGNVTELRQAVNVQNRRRARAEDELASVIDRLVEQPLSILKENESILCDDLEDFDYEKALNLQTTYGEYVVRDKKDFRRLALNTLEDAAMKWLVELYGALTRIDLGESTWEDQKLRVEVALRAFIGERDAPLVQKGQKFTLGPRKPRFDPLARIMTTAYFDLKKRNLGEVNARKLWRRLQALDPKREVIVDLDEDRLSYVNNKGELPDVTFAAFERRYTRLVDKLPTKLHPR